MYNLHDNTKLMVLAGKLAYLGSRVPESESYLTALDILAGF